MLKNKNEMKWRNKDCCIPYTFTLKILSSSPAGFTATHVYFPTSLVRDPKILSKLPSGAKLDEEIVEHGLIRRLQTVLIPKKNVFHTGICGQSGRKIKWGLQHQVVMGGYCWMSQLGSLSYQPMTPTLGCLKVLEFSTLFHSLYAASANQTFYYHYVIDRGGGKNQSMSGFARGLIRLELGTFLIHNMSSTSIYTTYIRWQDS